MPYVTPSPYKIRLWYPASATYAGATYSVEIKAPEVGNTSRKGRNQAMVKTRAGNVFVYDRGIDLDEEMQLKFKDVPNVEQAALLVFLTAVQWGLGKLKMEDQNGTERTVRIKSTETTFTDTGWTSHRDPQTSKILWDFDLDILDLSNNSEALETAELPVSSPLLLHLQDYNHPHNPQASITVNIADGAKVVETLAVRDWKAVAWLVCMEKDNARAFVQVNAVTDGYSTTDATTVDTTQQILSDLNGALAKITLSVDLTGAGSSQYVRLKAATTVNGYTIRVRRFKL